MNGNELTDEERKELGYIDTRGTGPPPRTDPTAHWVEAPTSAAEVTPPPPVPETPPDEYGTHPGAYLLSEGPDDAGNAACLGKMYEGRFLHCNAYGFLVYDGKCWNKRQAKARLVMATVKMLKARQHAGVEAKMDSLVRAARPSSYNVRSCLALFEALVSVGVGEFDSSPDHINCQNGVLDLRTGELTPHSSDQRFTYCLPIEYDPTADSAEWAEWLLETTGGRQEVVDYLQAAIGYSLTGHTSEECLFYLQGPTRAGKGTLTETMLTVLGRLPLSVEVDFRTFTARRNPEGQNFDLAPLKPCRFVAASESGKFQELNTERVKAITGGNDIRCAFKHKTHFSYRPQFKVWLSSNNQVNADPEDDALWGRVRVVTFPNSYLGREDKGLKARMKRPEVLAGIFSWAVAGAMYWYTLGDRGLIAPTVVVEDTALAREAIDYVGQWIEQQVTATDDPNTFVSNEGIKVSYRGWCDANGVDYPKGSGAITQSLKRRGYNAGVQKKVSGRVYKGCKGIAVRTGGGNGNGR